MHNVGFTEKREQVLTPKDIADIKEAFENGHTCKLTPEELQVIHDFVEMWKETRSIILKGCLAILFFIVVATIVLSVQHKIKIPGIG